MKEKNHISIALRELNLKHSEITLIKIYLAEHPEDKNPIIGASRHPEHERYYDDEIVSQYKNYFTNLLKKARRVQP